MTEISSIRDLIGLWPFRHVLAQDVGVAASRVHNWAKQDAIPARFHARVLAAAQRRGFGLTADLLVRLHDCDRVAGQVDGAAVDVGVAA